MFGWYCAMNVLILLDMKQLYQGILDIPYQGTIIKEAMSEPITSPPTYDHTVLFGTHLNTIKLARERAGFKEAPVKFPTANAADNSDNPTMMGPVVPYPDLFCVYQTTENTGSRNMMVPVASMPKM